MSLYDNKHQSGFTLIELLVVVIIISLSAGLMLINITFSQPEDAIEKEAQRLHALLRFAHQQAVIRAEEYGLRFYDRGYDFMIFNEQEQRWHKADREKHFTSHELDEAMDLDLFIEGNDVVLDSSGLETASPKPEQADTAEEDTEQIKPQVFLLSSGELSPAFVLSIRIPGIDKHYELHAHANGEYEIQQAD